MRRVPNVSGDPVAATVMDRFVAGKASPSEELERERAFEAQRGLGQEVLVDNFS